MPTFRTFRYSNVFFISTRQLRGHFRRGQEHNPQYLQHTRRRHPNLHLLLLRLLRHLKRNGRAPLYASFFQLCEDSCTKVPCADRRVEQSNPPGGGYACTFVQLSERSLLLANLSATDNKHIRIFFSSSCFLSFSRWFPPHRFSSTSSASLSPFSSTVWVIYRIHCRSTHCWANSEPA